MITFDQVMETIRITSNAFAEGNLTKELIMATIEDFIKTNKLPDDIADLIRLEFNKKLTSIQQGIGKVIPITQEELITIGRLGHPLIEAKEDETNVDEPEPVVRNTKKKMIKPELLIFTPFESTNDGEPLPADPLILTDQSHASALFRTQDLKKAIDVFHGFFNLGYPLFIPKEIYISINDPERNISGDIPERGVVTKFFGKARYNLEYIEPFLETRNFQYFEFNSKINPTYVGLVMISPDITLIISPILLAEDKEEEAYTFESYEDMDKQKIYKLTSEEFFKLSAQSRKSLDAQYKAKFGKNPPKRYNVAQILFELAKKKSDQEEQEEIEEEEKAELDEEIKRIKEKIRVETQ